MLPVRFKLDLCIFQILGRPHKEYGDLLLDEILWKTCRSLSFREALPMLADKAACAYV